MAPAVLHATDRLLLLRSGGEARADRVFQGVATGLAAGVPPLLVAGVLNTLARLLVWSVARGPGASAARAG
jgi:hypothetical protein